MSFPDNLMYTKDHEWLRIEGDHAYVGITNFAQSELGDIVFIDIDSEGEHLEKEEVFGGSQRNIKWYQFRVPVYQPDKVVGGIQDFKSIRFFLPLPPDINLNSKSLILNPVPIT